MAPKPRAIQYNVVSRRINVTPPQIKCQRRRYAVSQRQASTLRRRLQVYNRSTYHPSAEEIAKDLHVPTKNKMTWCKKREMSDWGECSKDRLVQRKNKRSGVVWRSCNLPEAISQRLRIDQSTRAETTCCVRLCSTAFVCPKAWPSRH
jgi:hypothetical protein